VRQAANPVAAVLEVQLAAALEVQVAGQAAKLVFADLMVE
jgi:hypothetical protein